MIIPPSLPHNLVWYAAALVLMLAAVSPARGQISLQQINPQTEVGDVDFKGNSTFTEDRLKQQIATRDPDFLSRIQFWKERQYPFRPIELQKDVVRLRNFYHRHGFLHPDIDYLVEHNQAKNTVHVVFTINQGPPLLVQDVNIVGPDSTRAAFYQFPEQQRQEWIDVRDRVLQRIGARFETNHLLAVRRELLTWLQNEGYAFAQVETDTNIVHFHPPDEPSGQPDFVDISVQVDTGPLSYLSDIQVTGNNAVASSVIRKAIPLDIGDRFSQQALNVAQRQLFSLNLFRMALVDVPDQPRDSTVTVRIRIQEADPRYLSAQTGYSLSRGVDLEGQWQHRNFLGNARSLIVSSSWSTGLAAFQRSNLIIPNRFRIGASLRQPFLFTPRLSAVIAPFYERREEQAFALQQYGLNSTLIYDFYRFRTLSFQHTITRTAPLVSTVDPGTAFFSRSVISANAQLGRANDYLNPSDGFLIQPFVELSDDLIVSDLHYVKVGIENSFYDTVTENVGIATRLFAGRLWPYGPSADQGDPLVRERFSDIRFYAGGSYDVRGWHSQLLGPKVIDTTASPNRFVPLGGRAKIFANFELRLPFPFLGSDWGTTTFVDAGYIGRQGLQVDPGAYQYGAGAGIRYTTPIGPLRLDVAFKLNPTELDIRPPDPVAEPSFWRRTVVYFSIGNPF